VDQGASRRIHPALRWNRFACSLRFDSKLTNGRVGAGNGLIRVGKAKARGYGTTKHLITVAYLVAGKLTQLPASPFERQAGAKASG